MKSNHGGDKSKVFVLSARATDLPKTYGFIADYLGPCLTSNSTLPRPNAENKYQNMGTSSDNMKTGMHCVRLLQYNAFGLDETKPVPI